MRIAGGACFTPCRAAGSESLRHGTCSSRTGHQRQSRSPLTARPLEPAISRARQLFLPGKLSPVSCLTAAVAALHSCVLSVRFWRHTVPLPLLTLHVSDARLQET